MESGSENMNSVFSALQLNLFTVPQEPLLVIFHLIKKKKNMNYRIYKYKLILKSLF